MKKTLNIIFILMNIAFISLYSLCGCTSKTEIDATSSTVDSVSDEISQYNKGVKSMKNNDWDDAIKYFSDIQYKDSSVLLEKCKKEKGMHENSDYDFLETMSKSIMKRYEASEENDDREKCIEIELEMIGDFKNKTFYDLELKQLADDYIDGVEIEKKSLTETDGNKQLKYYEGHAKRFKTLKKLTDNYGLLNDNIDYKTNYYNQADKEIEYYTAYKEIEADLKEQFGENVLCDYVDDVTSRIRIKNNTKYDYDMTIHFVFYDGDDTIVETNEVYYEDIKAGKKYNLDFYFPINAESFDYYTEEYIDL